jgi:type IV secretory pathway TrbF-like protein
MTVVIAALVDGKVPLGDVDNLGKANAMSATHTNHLRRVHHVFRRLHSRCVSFVKYVSHNHNIRRISLNKLYRYRAQQQGLALTTSAPTRPTQPTGKYFQLLSDPNPKFDVTYNPACTCPVR